MALLRHLHQSNQKNYFEIVVVFSKHILPVDSSKIF